MKHTPGKWKYRLNPDETEHHRHLYWIDTVDGRPICEVRNYHKIGENNAPLIAACPDMLEALEGALAALTQNKTYPADIYAAKTFLETAIKKAKGE